VLKNPKLFHRYAILKGILIYRPDMDLDCC
jgi:hypothetical protein